MNSIKKAIKIIAVSVIALLIFSAVYIGVSGPTLPKQTDNIIDSVLSNPIPALVKGKVGLAKSQSLNIWYESVVPKDSIKGVILLIMGISNDALGWPPAFIQSFVDAGYQVIRYDHRGTGLSDWVENWDKKKPYSLKDMADDGVAVLSELHVEKAHILGVSMGGMIAQELAINHPDRTASLTSIMSSGFITDPELPKISSSIAFDLIKTAIKYSVIGTERNMIKLHLASRMILMNNSDQDLDIKGLSEQVLYNIRIRHGYNARVSEQHQAAVAMSGSRYTELKTLYIPTLVIHGRADPFIPMAHGQKCAAIIPNSDSLWVNNMGHDLPNNKIKEVTRKAISFFHSTERTDRTK